MKHTAIANAQEQAAVRNVARRKPRTLSAEAIAAQAQLSETMARWKAEGNFPEIVRRRYEGK